MARRAARRRAGSLALALAVGWAVTGAAADAERERARWGRTVPVAVAVSELVAGQSITPADVTVERRPVHLVPDDALRTVPAGRRSTVDVPRGEVLLGTRVRDAVGAVAARLPEHEVGVSLPRSDLVPELELGDRVDLYAPAGEGTRPVARRVASGAAVVAVDETSITISVADHEVGDSTAAAMAGLVTVTLRSGS